MGAGDSTLPRIFSELSRRKVWQVAAIYMVAALAVAGGANDILPRLQLPDWTVTFVIVLTILAFPIAIALAWTYDITRGGIERTETRAIPEGAEMVAPEDVSAETSCEPSIVVLPFENLSPDASDAYLAEGLSEEITADLAGLRALRVISRASATQYRGTAKGVPAIARELSVRYVLEGSVRKAGEELRITAQLIDASTDGHLWARKYSGTMDEIFDLQERVSRSIVDSLELNLSPDEEARFARLRIEHRLAYECYLRAKQQLMTFTARGTESAIELLQKAMMIEGPNELLYATLGIAYTRAYMTIRPDSSFLEEANRYAAKAFERNPDSAGGHVVAGSVLTYRGRVQEGVRELKKALDSEPHNTYALLWLAATAEHAGHMEAARSYFRRLAAVDPLSEGMNATRSSFYSGDFRTAVEGFRAEWEVDPKSPYRRWAYGVCLAWAGEVEKGCEILEQVGEDDPDTHWGLFARFCVAALQGCAERADAAMSPEFQQFGERDIQFSWMIGACYARLGRVDEAVAWVRRAVELGFINHPFLAEREPFLRAIRQDHDFQRLLREVRERWEAFQP